MKGVMQLRQYVGVELTSPVLAARAAPAAWAAALLAASCAAACSAEATASARTRFSSSSVLRFAASATCRNICKDPGRMSSLLTLLCILYTVAIGKFWRHSCLT